LTSSKISDIVLTPDDYNVVVRAFLWMDPIFIIS